jgi:hypothetical protein
VSRQRLYIGGPLSGAVAEMIDGRWHAYRDDDGQPLEPRSLGDDVMYSQPASDRRYYYDASLPGGGRGYVHLTVFDHYLGACSWAGIYGEAVESAAIHKVMDL